MRLVLLACVFLAACGGGGGGDDGPAPTPVPQFVPGAYSSTFSPTGQPAEVGQLIFDTTNVVTYESKNFLGFGTWQRPSATVDVSLTVLPRRVDSLNNEFPSARSPGTIRAFRLNVGATALAGEGWQLLPANTTAPTLTSIPRNYRFRNLYNFSGTFLDYTLQIDVDSAGVLTGFDTNDCRFTGRIETRSAADRIYNARIDAFNCGNTNAYIQNLTYPGYAFTTPAVTGTGSRLHFIGVNAGAQSGMAFVLQSQ